MSERKNRQTDGQSGGQVDKETSCQRHIQTDGQKERHTWMEGRQTDTFYIHMNRETETNGQKDGQIERQMADSWTSRKETDGQTNRLRDRQMDRKTNGRAER